MQLHSDQPAGDQPAGDQPAGDQPTAAAPRLAHAARDAALALVGFVAVAALVRQLVPWPRDYALGAKMDWLEEHGDEIDLLLLGSSRVFRSFEPAVIDAELARHGLPLTTFNAGVAGLRPLEADYLLRKVLAGEPERLRWVVIEAGARDPELLAGDAFDARTVHWHTPRQTLAALRATRRADLPPAAALALAWTHVRMFAWNVASYGRLGQRARDALDADSAPYIAADELERTRGYQPLEALAGAEYEARRRRHVENRAAWEARVERLVRKAEQREQPPPYFSRVPRRYDLAALESQIAAIRAAGAEPIYVVPPTTVASQLPHRLAAAGVLPALLAYDDPRAWPQVYTFEGFFDKNHVTRDGARAFSRAFARELAQLLGAREGER